MASGRVDDPRACDLRIFINYRRNDAPSAAGRLADDLGRHFGDDHVFMDVDTLDPGVDWEEAINNAVGACDVLIAVIGRDWLNVSDSRGRRLDASEDYVRFEIEAALNRNVRVIPTLVEGADPPTAGDLPGTLAPLARRHAVELRETRWRSDVEELIRALERVRSGKAPAPPEPNEPASGPRWQRPAWLKPWVVAAAAVLVAAAVAGGILLTSGGGSGGDQMGSGGMPGKMMKPGVFPDAIEDELVLAHIPEGVRDSCRRTSPLASRVFLRTVRCSQGGGGSVTYSRAHSAPALNAFFKDRVNRAGLTYPTKSSCSNSTAATDEWLRQGTMVHVEQRSSQAEGRVLCFRTGSTAYIVWTDSPTKLYGEASRPAGDAKSLYSWWHDGAGPESELAMSSGMEKKTWPYPDAIEKDLLLDHVPPMIRKTCHRSTDFETNVFLRAVECSQGMAGAKVKYLYAHSAIALRGYSTNQITAAGLQLPTGRCENDASAAGWWVLRDDIVHVERRGERRDGRVLCWVAAGDERIEWTDNATGIYASAARPASERKALYMWWQKQAGPGALEMTGMSGGMG
jgi:hypothetical protein